MKKLSKALLWIGGFLGAYWLFKGKTQTKGVLIPGNIPPESVYNQTIAELKRRAMTQLNLTERGIVVRSLTPADVGRSNWSFNLDPGANTIVNTSVNDNRFIAITGMVYSGNLLDEVDISAGASERDRWSLEQVRAQRNASAYLMEPIIVEQNQPITLTAYANVKGSDSFGLQGIVVEKAGIAVVGGE